MKDVKVNSKNSSDLKQYDHSTQEINTWCIICLSCLISTYLSRFGLSVFGCQVTWVVDGGSHCEAGTGAAAATGATR